MSSGCFSLLILSSKLHLLDKNQARQNIRSCSTFYIPTETTDTMAQFLTVTNPRCLKETLGSDLCRTRREQSWTLTAPAMTEYIGLGQLESSKRLSMWPH